MKEPVAMPRLIRFGVCEVDLRAARGASPRRRIGFSLSLTRRPEQARASPSEHQLVS